MFEHWGSELAGGSDEWSSYMMDDAMFYYADQNGYYDHLEGAPACP